MAWYRLYRLRRGHIVSGEDFEADSDGEAAATAAAKVGDLAYELWEGRRKVAAADPDSREGGEGLGA